MTISDEERSLNACRHDSATKYGPVSQIDLGELRAVGRARQLTEETGIPHVVRHEVNNGIWWTCEWYNVIRKPRWWWFGELVTRFCSPDGEEV